MGGRDSVYKNDEYLRPIVDRQKRSECECIHKGDDKNSSLWALVTREASMQWHTS